MATLFISSLFVLTITPSLSPGLDDITNSISPLDNGFSALFSIPQRYGILFTLPGLFATAHGFLYAGAIQISSMGQSKLFPELLGRTTKRYKSDKEKESQSLNSCSDLTVHLKDSNFSETTKSPADSYGSEEKREHSELSNRPSSPHVHFSNISPSPSPSAPTIRSEGQPPAPETNPRSNIPLAALIFTSFVCFMLCIICTFVPYLSHIIFPLSTCCGYLMYLAILSSYIIFKLRYSSCKRYFLNPLGIFSALLSFAIFTLCLISLLVIRPAVDIYKYLNREDSEHERSLISIGIPIALLICLAILSVYYYHVAKDQMHYSEDEQKEMFSLLLIHRKSSSVQSSPLNSDRKKVTTPESAASHLHTATLPSHS